MDNLRALAMLAGVLFHAALAYSPLMHPYFPTADRHNAPVVDAVAWLLHLFRMPVFFVVAGFFAATLAQRRGFGGLMRDRLRRIALPFVLFLPPVLWALSASTMHAAATAAHPSPVLQWLAQASAMADPPQAPPGTAHLWFLHYLLLFYVLAWVGRTLGLGRAFGALRTVPAIGWLLGLPLLLAPALAMVAAPHPAPESPLPQLWALLFFGAFFACGWFLHGDDALLDRLRRWMPLLLVGALVLHALFLRLLAGHPPGPANPTATWPLALVQGFASAWSTLACLVGARALLARRTPLLRYLADISYWTYLVHLPLLFVVQYRLMDLDWHWGWKLLAAVATTLAACIASYELLVRRTPLRHLVGRSAPPTADPR
jgi:glucan biosynthesis protein C